MALRFICDICSKEYEAYRDRGALGVSYQADNKRYTLIHNDDPCNECEVEAEKAKKEALAKRKKKV